MYRVGNFVHRFNTQPPEGGCCATAADRDPLDVSTHSRPKAAATHGWANSRKCTFQHTAARRRLGSPKATANGSLSFNTQPPEGGCYRGSGRPVEHLGLSFNTQPPEGGCHADSAATSWAGKFQHTAARRRLLLPFVYLLHITMFQHTAARRRLAEKHKAAMLKAVSTHSRPKAAVLYWHERAEGELGFNTQPPEGG